MRERHVTNAESIEISQRVERILDGIPAFDAHKKTDTVLLLGSSDLGRGRTDRKIARAFFRLAIGRVDQVHRPTHRSAGCKGAARDIDRHEFARHPPGLKPCEIGMHSLAAPLAPTYRAGTQIEILIDHRPCNVVVAVDNYRLLVDL